MAPGANAGLTPKDVEAAEELITGADVVVMQLETPLETVERAATLAREHGARVILNPAPAQPLSDEILGNVSILTPNESEAELLTGIQVEDDAGAEEAARALVARGVDTVILTLGARGAFVFESESGELVPGFEVDAVDTTAAGDVFNGSLAVGLAEGMPLARAVSFANAAGRAFGDQAGGTTLGADPRRDRHLSGRFAVNSRLRQQAAKIISGLAALFILMGAEVSLAQSEDETVTERRLKVSDYRQKMMAGWIGQMVGVGWGAPTEFRWTNEIIPEDQVPEWRPEMVNVWGQDDLYVEMTFLRSLEEHGLDVSMRQAGIDFANSEYDLWHANKAGRDNLRQGIAPPDSSHPQFSIHADDIDYQIEADFSGLISPGLPNSVIALGEKFGRLMNYGDGVYGGQFVGCMYAEAFFEEDPRRIIEAGLKCIPGGSQYAEMVRDVTSWHDRESR